MTNPSMPSLDANLGRPRILRRVLGTLLAGSVIGTVCVGTVAACDGNTTLDGHPDCEIEKPERDSCAEITLEIESDVEACPKNPTLEQCRVICGHLSDCSVVGSTVKCPSFCAVDGRRPEGLAPPPTTHRDHDVLAGHFAEMSYHEAAAAHAFAQLIVDLRAAGAPESLLDALRCAQQDELRHAELAAEMARRHGGAPAAPAVPMRPARRLLAVAFENAREGCGRELLGAAVGLHIAEHADDGDVRELYSSIARDEVRHAAVSLRMQRWIRARLTPEECRQVDAAMVGVLTNATTAGLPRALRAPDDAHLRYVGGAMTNAVIDYLDRPV